MFASRSFVVPSVILFLNLVNAIMEGSSLSGASTGKTSFAQIAKIETAHMSH